MAPSAPSRSHRPERQPPRATLFTTSRATSRATSVTTTRETIVEDDDEAESDALDEVVMSVDFRGRGKLGCAYYVAREEKLYFLNDMEFGNIDTIDSLQLYIEPTVVLASIKADDALIDRLDPNFRARGVSGAFDDQFNLPYALELRPAGEYRYELARNKLASLDVREENNQSLHFVVPGDFGMSSNVRGSHDVADRRQAQLLNLSGCIDVESKLTVGCAGALLCYLQRRRAAAFLPGDEVGSGFFQVRDLEMFSLKDTMFINMDTLASLQVIQSESHPHTHNQGPIKSKSGSKEGLSVYGLFHFLASTFQGRHLLRQYFLRPSRNLAAIRERHETVRVLLRPDNSDNFHALIRYLKFIKNMRPVLINLRKGISTGDSRGRGLGQATWRHIRNFAYYTIKILDVFQDLHGAANLAIMNKINSHFEPYHLAQIGRSINDTIDFEESKICHRLFVKAGMSHELDEQRQVNDGIEDLLGHVAEVISGKIPAQLGISVNTVYFPQIGFLIALPVGTPSGVGVWQGTVDEPWERMFATEVAAYYKSPEMAEMDEKFGDVYGTMCDLEIEIIHNLAQTILEYEEIIVTASDICGELDALVALSQGAKNYHLVEPEMTEENVLHVEGGRHILQERCVSSFVPNDIYLVGGKGEQLPTSERDDTPSDVLFESSKPETTQPTGDADMTDEYTGPSTLILTGPNHSGKSVYLKQAAIIVFMAHVGSFVPAQRATIGLTDKILTRIATRETVSRTQSSFMIDLQQVSMALKLATRRSLLILDEFGKGTNATDGAALACSVFEYLLSQGDEAPKVLGATHYHEIFESGSLPARPQLQLGHMEVRMDARASQVEDQITYLYTFRDGRSGASYGTICAEMNGIPSNIVARADRLTLYAASGEDLVGICAPMSEEDVRDLMEAERIARDFLMVDLDGEGLMGILEEMLTAEEFSADTETREELLGDNMSMVSGTTSRRSYFSA